MGINGMKSIILITQFLMCTNIGLSQEYEYRYGNVNLTEIESGIYEDDFGKCYGEFVLFASYDKVVEYRNRYSNKEIETTLVEVGNFQIEIAEKQSAWIKKKANRNCLSADPNDCLVWCPVNTPRRIVSLELIDEEGEINVGILNEEFRKLLIDSGYIVYSEINCDNDDEILNTAVRLKLSNYFNEIIEIHDVNLFLSSYQYENDLPIGGLNLETLYELEVN